MPHINNRLVGFTGSRNWLRIGVYVGLTAALIPSLSYATSTYVSDQFEITLRTGPNTSNKITKMLKSGDKLEVLPGNAKGYTKIRDSNGSEGWVLSRFLMDQPSPRTLLSDIQNREVSLLAKQDDINSARIAAEQTQTELGQSKQQIESLQQELTLLKRVAADSISLHENNIELTQSLLKAREEKDDLFLENKQLRKNAKQTWFLYGAGVILLGMVLGLLIPKKRTWESF